MQESNAIFPEIKQADGWKKDRERERERETDRQTDRHSDYRNVVTFCAIHSSNAHPHQVTDTALTFQPLIQNCCWAKKYSPLSVRVCVHHSPFGSKTPTILSFRSIVQK
jgi:hypothetical protein